MKLLLFSIFLFSTPLYSTVTSWKKTFLVVEDQGDLRIQKVSYKDSFSTPESQVHSIFSSFKINNLEVNEVSSQGIKLVNFDFYNENGCSLEIDFQNDGSKTMRSENARVITTLSIRALAMTLVAFQSDFVCKITYNGLERSAQNQWNLPLELSGKYLIDIKTP